MTATPPEGRARASAIDRFLPPLALLVLTLFVGLASWAAAQAGTLGFDYLSYDSAVRRFLAGGVLYDQNFQTTGPFGLFYYPPPFVLLAIPLTLLPPDVDAWLAAIALTAIFLVAVAILPVSSRVRWLIVLLGGLSWPLVYAIKLGQVGPILLLTFAMGWRWMDRPHRLGLATAVGAAIKLQPLIILGWALLTGRRRAVVVGLAAFLVLAIAGTLIAGPAAWADQLGLLVRLSKPVSTPNNVTPGRIAFEAGFGDTLAWAIQFAWWAAVVAVVLYVLWRGTGEASYLAVVTASQAISPILWDHYALMLLLPVAWLLQRRLWWAALIPLATSLPLIEVTPRVFYPITYAITLLLIAWQGTGSRRLTLELARSPDRAGSPDSVGTPEVTPSV
ncbi:MAG TPA: glycosyltransferase family 87 protein [Candidatus Limnocylindrales bacterium]